MSPLISGRTSFMGMDSPLVLSEYRPQLENDEWRLWHYVGFTVKYEEIVKPLWLA